MTGDYWRDRRIPARGLAVARMCAHITYLSEEALTRKFGRRLQNAPKDSTEAINLFGEMFEVESYLRHQGSTFVQRFDANSYLTITRAMDYFDLAADYGGDLAMAFKGTRDPVPAGVVHLRLAVSDDAEPRHRARAEPRGRERVVRRNPHRQGPRRVPAGRAGFPSHPGRLPARLRDACGAAERSEHARPGPLPGQEHAGRSGADRRMIAPGSRVLDIGCGDGTLIDHLFQTKACDARGIEIDMARGDPGGRAWPAGDAGRRRYRPRALSRRRVRLRGVVARACRRSSGRARCCAQMLRIGTRAVVSFPNFGHWAVRWQLLSTGRMPMTRGVGPPVA